MNARLITHADRAIFTDWRRAHELPPLPEAVLPECGVVVESDEGQPLALAYLQMDDSTGVAMLSWTIANPAGAPRENYLAVAMLFQAVREVALTFDYGVIMAGASDDAMRRLHVSSGFVETDTAMTHMLMHLPDRGPAESPAVRTVNVRDADRAAYSTAMAWWKGHGWPGVNLAMLPRRGLLVESPEGVSQAFGWLYRDNSVPVVMLEWIVTNPANTPKQSLGAVLKLIEAAKATAAAEGCRVMLTSVRQPALERVYERAGFVVLERGLTHLVMITGLENPAAAARLPSATESIQP